MSDYISLDRYEIENYLKPEKPKLGKIYDVALVKGEIAFCDQNDKISLDGEWDMIKDEGHSDFSAAIKAKIPCSVHTALIENGVLKDENGEVITDAYFGKNDAILREASKNGYRFKKLFTLTEDDLNNKLMLCFEGVCEYCEVWLNGKFLGSHRGMFGGPDFLINDKVKLGENELILLLHGAPFRPRKPFEFPTFFGGGNPWLNLGWLDTVIFNCSYGWHYADIPPLGIWRSVYIKKIPKVEIVSSFIKTLDTDGNMELTLELRSDSAVSVTLSVEIAPKNFKGDSQSFSIKSDVCGNEILTYRFKIENPQLWWPNGMGKQNLYTLRLTACDDEIITSNMLSFGIRTVEMIANANANGERIAEPGRYNWTFVINGKPFFIKGTGWCTIDALMRFDKKNYEKYLNVAKNQNINMLRAWGGGLVETDDFYDICDEYGIAVFQEWPTAWDSYMIQPLDALLETVERGIKRLRNRPSLLIWCGGNEGAAPLEPTELFDPENLNKIGKLTLELDNTRPWHRQEPCGGSMHNYDASWGWQNPSVNMKMEAPFLGEFGVDCWPNIESVKRFTNNAELERIKAVEGDGFAIEQDGDIAHHTPMFNKAGDVGRLQNHVELFTEKISLENSIIGSQLAQVVGVKYTLERARTRWPECSGAIMYKLNDPYPAASWSTVDWYGSPKAASYFVADTYQPTVAIARFDNTVLSGEVDVPLYLCNEAERDDITEVHFKAYNQKGEMCAFESFSVTDKAEYVEKIGTVRLSAEVTEATPLCVVTDVLSNDKLISRNWYFLNYENSRGCLFAMPKTELLFTVEGNTATVKNVGKYPAIAVQFDAQKVSDTFRPDDNWFWLDAGEEISIEANSFEGVKGVFAWNT